MSPTPHCSHKQRSNIKRVHFHLLSTNSLNHLLRDCCCSKGSPLPLQRIVQLLSIGAFELRKGISDRFEANGIEEKENQQQKYLNKLIRNERLLIEVFTDQLENLCLQLSNFSLPQVCKPRVVFLSSNKKLNTRIDRIVYQARSEVTARVDIAGSLLCSILVVAGFVREELWGGERHYFFDFAGSGRGLLIETE
uniref:Uncharacterized protein n=1 Tax=Meloidogyne hapla TaxID=6305 RepID=A0A1I8BSP5_MELHA